MDRRETEGNSKGASDGSPTDAAARAGQEPENTPPGRSIKQPVVVLVLMGVSFALGLVMVEIVLRIVQPIPSGYYFWTPNMRETFRPDPEITPGISGESKFVANSIGIRGDELLAEHARRILAIGGSTTECIYLDQSETWPALLQEILNTESTAGRTWVGNAGKSGRNARHHLIALKHLPLRDWGIDTVIMMVGANDLGTRLAHDRDYDPHFLDKPGSEEKLLVENFAGVNNPDIPAYKKTAIWRLLRAVKKVVVERNSNQDERGRTMTVRREHRRNTTKMRAELPDLTTALGEYRRNIEQIVNVAEQKSVRLILVTQPTLWRPDLPPDLEDLLWLGGVGDFMVKPDQPYYAVAPLSDAMNRYNQVLLGVCQDRGVECIDLAAILPQDTTVYYDDFHFNESGARRVAQALATRIQASAVPAGNS